MQGKQNKKFLIMSILIALTITLSGLVLPIGSSHHVIKISSEAVGGITNITATPDYCFKGVYCISSLLAEREGYARNVTGGLGGYVYFVTSLEDDPTNPQPGTLRHALTQAQPLWIFFLVNGTITLRDRISVTSNKTIDGRGAQITITTRYSGSARGQALRIYDVDNIIIVNIRFDSTDTRNIDAIEVRRSNNIWIHHCDFTNWSDGGVDLAEASTTRTNNITISWSRFWNHDKVTLIGNSATRTTDRNFRVTLHHNYYFMTQDRHPRLRFGIVDMYNNYLYRVGEATGISQKGLVYAEANIYELVPGDTEIADCTWTGESPGYFFNVSNWFIKPPGANAIIDGCWTNTTYVRPYPANVEPADEDLKRKIMKYAGTDFPLLPRLMIDHPSVQWGEYEWDLPLPTSILSLSASFVIDVTPYKAPEEEIIEIEWYMGDGTRYTGTPLDFLNRTTSDLRVRHTYPAPGIYTITVLMRSVGGSTLLVSNLIYVNISMIQTITTTLIQTTTTTVVSPTTVTLIETTTLPTTVISPTTVTAIVNIPITTTVVSERTITTTLVTPTTIRTTVATPTTILLTTVITTTIPTTLTTIIPTTITSPLTIPTTITIRTTVATPTTLTISIPTTMLLTTTYSTTGVSISLSTSTVTEKVTDWTLTSGLAAALLVVGLGIGLFVKRK
ncbi:MAG: hypothetical protein QXH10_07745 [Ignisphaera sp.]